MRWRFSSTSITFTLNDLAGLDDFVRVFDELIRQRGHVHEAVLMHADVDEGAESGDVGHDAFEDHAGLQVGERLDALLKRGGLEFGPRIAAGLFQFGEDVAHRRHAEFVIGEFVRRKPFSTAGLAHDFADPLPMRARMRSTTG